MLVTLLGQAGTSVRGAYEVLVSMGILSYFVPYLFLFAAMIRLQNRPTGPEVRRVPGGKPVAIALACVGLASTALTIVLSAFPADDEPDKFLAVVKVVGGTLVLVGAGFAVFIGSRLITRHKARSVLNA
jgi:amino acid transporter